MLFVAVTLFGLWLGWEVRQVQLRKDWVARFQAAGGDVVWRDVASEMYRKVGKGHGIVGREISWYRRLLGDRAVFILDIAVPNDSDPELGAAKSVFPEAIVRALTPGMRRDMP
jgi:hypothetical protein